MKKNRLSLTDFQKSEHIKLDLEFSAMIKNI